MSHAPLIASEAGEYGDTGTCNVFRSSRRFWIAECSCGWHAGSGLGLAWFVTKREAMAAWRGHTGEAEGDKGMTTELCIDRMDSCSCGRTKDHETPHVCACGSAWGHDGVPMELPPHGEHCTASCDERHAV